MAGNTVEHVGEFKENCGPCWWEVVGHGCGDVFFYLELHGVDDKVCAIRGANSVVKWEHVLRKLFFECLSNVCSHKSSDGCGYTKGPEF